MYSVVFKIISTPCKCWLCTIERGVVVIQTKRTIRLIEHCIELLITMFGTVLMDLKAKFK